MRVKKTTVLRSAASTVIVVIVFYIIFNSENIFSSHALPKRGVPVKVPRKVVCPERNPAPQHFSEAKWVEEKCDYGVPMLELVTVVLLDSNHQIALDVQRSLPGVTVVMPLNKGDAHLSDSGSIKYVTPSSSSSDGEIWNTLLSVCDTPYTLVAVNVVNFALDLRSLQRLVRVLSETEGTQVVGGSTRNATGHWRVGCYQMTLDNYVLTYTKGYHESTQECMVCDFVDAPFLAETRLLKEVPMNEELPANMMLMNFFLKIFEFQKSLLCPDVMLDANDFLVSAPAKDKHYWKALATMWQLNRVHIRFPRSAILHKFKCSEVGLKCNAIGVQLSKTLPVCCREEFARIMGFWARFADANGIAYKFLSGSLLGAVKMADVMPWDIDSDMIFDRANFSFVQSSIAVFRKAGINLRISRKPSRGTKFESWGYVKVWSSGFLYEMYAAPTELFRMKPGEVAPQNASRTKVEIHGVWVDTAFNPGLYTRGRYGKGMLKHALSWRHTGKKSSFDPYDPGIFEGNCGENWHHACLDDMPVDGSIYYNVPEY